MAKAQRSEQPPEAGWFGDQPIDPAAKTARVGAVFSSVAKRYDLMNDLMSGGLHRWWKDRFIDVLRPWPGIKVLDLAGGTGDIAFRIHERVKGAADVTLADINPDMLAVGRSRADDRALVRGLEFVTANAESLPFDDDQFDAVTISFGLRNVTNIDAALNEMRRVTKPGGRVLCMEFSTVVAPPLRAAYRRYSDVVIPRLGAVIAQDRDSYQYLVESIRRFPDQAGLTARFQAAGLQRVTHRNLTGGVVAIHEGWRV